MKTEVVTWYECQLRSITIFLWPYSCTNGVWALDHKGGTKAQKAIQMADGTFTSLSIESEIPISRSETEIYNKFPLLHVKTNTDIFFISDWL